MKTKLVQHVLRIIFNVLKVFEVFKFPNFGIPGSKFLSDVQTFFIIHPLRVFACFCEVEFGYFPCTVNNHFHFSSALIVASILLRDDTLVPGKVL